MTMSAMPVIDGICLDCVRELDHCHGTLIVHLDGSFDCTADHTDAECPELHIARHGLVIDCQELSAGCGCGRGH